MVTVGATATAAVERGHAGYLSSVVLTLYFAMWQHSYIGSLFFSAMQVGTLAEGFACATCGLCIRSVPQHFARVAAVWC